MNPQTQPPPEVQDTKMTQNPVSLTGIIDTKALKDNIIPKNKVVADWCCLWWKPVLSEFISTTLLILLGCMTCVALPDSKITPLYVPLGFGIAVLINIQIFGHISGAYMNPSVTIAAVLWGHIPTSVGICFIIVECLGAIVGYGILVALSPLDMAAGAICVTKPLESLSFAQSLGIEIAATTALNFLNCGVWDPINEAKQDSVPIKFGLAIAGLSFAAGPLTGCSMNPARSLGPAVWTGVWTQHWIYWVGPLIGALLPIVLYKYLLMKRKPKSED